MTHTPKPWIVRTDTAIVNLVVSPPGEPAIAGIFPQYGADGEPKYDIYAHAYLIAAAPELLDFASIINKFAKNPTNRTAYTQKQAISMLDWMISMADEIVRKARGEQP